MSTFSPHFVKFWIKGLFPSLRKTQGINLAQAVFGIAKARSGLLSEMVREMPGAVKHKHRLKRLWRFVSNYRVKPERLFGFWIKWCFSLFSSGKYVSVAIDWTTLPGNLPCLMLAIPFKARGIPLIWQIVPFWALKDSQNRIEERLIARLINLIPQDKRIIILADRGFGRAEFVKFLLKKELLFSLRIRADVIIRTRKGKAILLRRLSLKPNNPCWFAKIAYRNDGLVTGVNLAAIVALGSNDPWFLITNLRKVKTAILRYEARFQIEEWFKDVKHGLGITDLQTKNLKRVRRILFVSCLAYGLLMLIGILADKFSTWKDNLITKGKTACSKIWFALRIIQYKMAPAYFWRRVWLKSKDP